MYQKIKEDNKERIQMFENKKKLLAKQARGKKRMKRFGKVDIPSEAFTIMLRRD